MSLAAKLCDTSVSASFQYRHVIARRLCRASVSNNGLENNGLVCVTIFLANTQKIHFTPSWKTRPVFFSFASQSQHSIPRHAFQALHAWKTQRRRSVCGYHTCRIFLLARQHTHTHAAGERSGLHCSAGRLHRLRPLLSTYEMKSDIAEDACP